MSRVQPMTIGLFSVLSFALSTTFADAAIVVTNGGFENPDVGSAQVQNITEWFDSTGNFTSWQQSDTNSGGTSNGSQAGVIGTGGNGWIYQSLGTLDAGTTSLDWSFDQITFLAGNSGSGLDVRFFAGNAAGADGSDIDSLGLTQVGSTVSFLSLANLGQVGQVVPRAGSVDVSALSAGTTVWVDFTSTTTGNVFALLDNVSVTPNISAAGIPEPSTFALAALGLLGLMARRQRRRG